MYFLLFAIVPVICICAADSGNVFIKLFAEFLVLKFSHHRKFYNFDFGKPPHCKRSLKYSKWYLQEKAVKTGNFFE